MTDTESRIQHLEQTVHSIDKRQESFETFMRAYIEGNEKRLDRIDARMDRLESKMDSQFQSLTNQFHNVLVAGGVGVMTIIVTILATK